MNEADTRQLLQAMRVAVISGRMMRARQNAYFKSPKNQTALAAAKLAETEFDTKSLEAIRLEERLQREGD